MLSNPKAITGVFLSDENAPRKTTFFPNGLEEFMSVGFANNYIRFKVNRSPIIQNKALLFGAIKSGSDINSKMGQRISRIGKGIDLLYVNFKQHFEKLIKSVPLIGKEFNYLYKKLYISTDSERSELMLLVSAATNKVEIKSTFVIEKNQFRIY